MDNVNKAKAIADFMFGNGRSRAASVSGGSGSGNVLSAPRAWEMDENGVIVSEPIRQEKENCTLTHLGGKSASVTSNSINKLKVIHDFIASNGRV